MSPTRKDPEATLSRPALGNGENAWATGVGREGLKTKVSLGQIAVPNSGVVVG
jgi:hypothetical protein